MERFARQRRAVDEMIYDEIARRRGRPTSRSATDVLSMLLLARDEDGEAMTDAELRDELVTLLVAGHETTATGLAWAFEELLRNPAVLARAQAAAAADDTAYLDAVVKETLRRRTVVPGVGRVVRNEPFQLNGYTIPPGIEINPSIAAIHRRADRYPAPTEFRPERFLGPDAPDTYTWLPFGGGTRRCLGASFATFEMRVVIARVLERTQLATAGPPEKGVRKGVTIVPRRGVRVTQSRARSRRQPRLSQKSRNASANSGLPPGALETPSVRAPGNAATASANPSSVKLRQPTCWANSSGPPYSCSISPTGSSPAPSESQAISSHSPRGNRSTIRPASSSSTEPCVICTMPWRMNSRWSWLRNWRIAAKISLFTAGRSLSMS